MSGGILQKLEQDAMRAPFLDTGDATAETFKKVLLLGGESIETERVVLSVRKLRFAFILLICGLGLGTVEIPREKRIARENSYEDVIQPRKEISESLDSSDTESTSEEAFADFLSQIHEHPEETPAEKQEKIEEQITLKESHGPLFNKYRKKILPAGEEETGIKTEEEGFTYQKEEFSEKIREDSSDDIPIPDSSVLKALIDHTQLCKIILMNVFLNDYTEKIEEQITLKESHGRLFNKYRKKILPTGEEETGIKTEEEGFTYQEEEFSEKTREDSSDDIPIPDSSVLKALIDHTQDYMDTANLDPESEYTGPRKTCQRSRARQRGLPDDVKVVLSYPHPLSPEDKQKMEAASAAYWAAVGRQPPTSPDRSQVFYERLVSVSEKEVPPPTPSDVETETRR
ncbi:unnamed protein product [Notodromas monacha]|uniref:Uncharacterized protein n=1 Tax=Notodromas monacha TaxID=399045 RepID=A0A7R9GGI8_9CRUS|nr:unnamed protein product [Notodromas monacha]CAG0920243.1 unnamed protein product [Notodromas monacha]